MLPAARLRITICTSCWVDEESDTLGAFRLERHLSVRADGEPAQPRQRCRLALTESAKKLVYHRIQTVRRLGLNSAGVAAVPSGPPLGMRPKRAAANENGKKPNWLDRTAERNKTWWPSWMKWK